MYQKITVVGHLGGDPEMRYMADGTAVTNFSVATSRRWTNSDGSKGEETTWFRAAVWGKQAEACNQWLVKGRKVWVEGRLNPDKATGSPRTFERRDGSIGAAYEITAENILFLDGQNGNSQREAVDSTEDIPI